MIFVIGAGFSGAVVARTIVDNLDERVVVFDQRDHVGGNCHTERDRQTGILVHTFGPHIFNTNDSSVWEYVNRFAKFRPYSSHVKAHTSRGIYSLPINLHTINQFYQRSFTPSEAKSFIESISLRNESPKNFEEYALSVIGEDLYKTFLHGYTLKQWGCEPRFLPADIAKRLPVRFNYDSNYYNTTYQGIPEQGYTFLIERILDHPNIEVKLNTNFEHSMLNECEHLFFTGPLDYYYDYCYGKLAYRTVYWKRVDAEDDYQGNAIINYTELDSKHTRVIEPKHFMPWEKHTKTVAFYEFSKETENADIPYYPKRLPSSMEILNKYITGANSERKTSFLGRLGTYRYLNMDQVIAEALASAEDFMRWREDKSQQMPIFSKSPL